MNKPKTSQTFQQNEDKRLIKRKVNDDTSILNNNDDLGFIGCGIVTKKDYSTPNTGFSSCWSKSNQKGKISVFFKFRIYELL